MDQSVQELNITELRLKKRPLWMSDLGIEDYSDIVGGGGDIYKDRLPPAWPRHEGMELTAEEEEEVGPNKIEAEAGEGGTQFYSGQLQQPVTAEKYSQSRQPQTETSEQFSPGTQQAGAGGEGGIGLGIQADVEAKVSGLTETVGEVVDTVKKTAETATETLTGVAGSLTGLFKGKGKKKK